MQRFCPHCQATVERSFLCPTCGRQLIEANPDLAPQSTGITCCRVTDRPTFAGSVLVGLLVAQCLYYAVRNLATAYLIAACGSAGEADFWQNLAGLVTEQVLQSLALVAGGFIAGAGHHQSVAAGAALGVANSVLLSGMLVVLRRTPNELILYGQPVLHAFVGAISGFIGQRIWQPVPDLAPIARVSRMGEELLSIVLPEFEEIPEVEPLPWGRILLGSVVAMGGTMWARLILAFVLSGGEAHELLQSQFITWEITVVAQLLGGGIAGSNTRRGFHYGFWVGILAAAMMLLLLSTTEMRLATHEVLASILGLAISEGSPTAVMFQAGQALMLGLLGGWLGSLILPRITRKKRRSRAEA